MVLSMEKWAGKVAVVTGASAGIGKSIAEKLVKNGMIVVGLARRVESVEEHSKQLQRESGKLHAMKVDLTNADEVVKVFQEIEQKFKSIHILVNNAGVYPPGRLWNGDIEKWKKILDTNVLALCIASRESIRIMNQNEISGVIFNLNSIAGHKVLPVLDLHIYQGSKHAVTAICETLRKELVSEKSKIRVTSISPGATVSEQRKDLNLDEPEDITLLNPEDVADSIEYVLSTPDHVQVVGLARRVDQVEKLSEELINESGNLYSMKVDVTQDEQLLKAFSDIEERFGVVHVLINNAGIFPPDSLMEGDITIWRQVMDTNLMALCIATREVIRIMRKYDFNGVIININSITGHKIPDYPNLHLYPASKHAVTAVTETLRKELIAAGSKIRVSSLSPGVVLTEGAGKLGIKETGSIPILYPQDIADAVAYILSTPERVHVNELIIKPVGETI